MHRTRRISFFSWACVGLISQAAVHALCNNLISLYTFVLHAKEILKKYVFNVLRRIKFRNSVRPLDAISVLVLASRQVCFFIAFSSIFRYRDHLVEDLRSFIWDYLCWTHFVIQTFALKVFKELTIARRFVRVALNSKDWYLRCLVIIKWIINSIFEYRLFNILVTVVLISIIHSFYIWDY